MSRLIVEVCRVEAISKHPNADAMELVHVKGWQVCAKIGDFCPGDRCVYFPPDSVLPEELANRLGVLKYLGPLAKDAFGNRPPGGRVRVAKLRGVPSYGLIMPAADNPDWDVGTDVATHYGVTKWEPPPEHADGESEPGHPAFHTYTSIENFRNFPQLFQADEDVIFTEKIHGMNARVGLVPTDAGPVFMAGSHGQRRKEFDAKGRRSRFWEALTDNVKALLDHLAGGGRSVVLFGEIFGSGVQDMVYGHGDGRRSFRGFDIAVNGSYLDFDEKDRLFHQFGVAPVPVLYRGPFVRELVEAYCTGPTTVCEPAQAGKHTFREGIVIAPVRERFCPELGGSGRLVLKAINPDYLLRKDGTEYH